MIEFTADEMAAMIAEFNEMGLMTAGTDESITEYRSDREDFFADAAVWEHEFCGSECDGSDHR